MNGKGSSKGKAGNIPSLVLKLFLFVNYIIFQSTYLMISPMLTDSGVPDLSISNVPTGLYAGFFIMSPSIIAALVVWKMIHNPKLKRVLLIFLSIIIILGIDIIQPMVGASSVSGYISNRLYENKVSLVNENHPSKDRNNIEINTSYGSYYYETNKQDVKCVLLDRIEILDKELDSGSREVLYYLDMGDGLDIEVLQQQDRSGLPLVFRVSGGDYIFLTDNSLLFQGEQDAPYAYIEPYVELVKDGTVISIASSDDPLKGLHIDSDRLGLVFIKDGEQILRRNFDDGSEPFDISELDLLMDDGEWSATLYTYVNSLEGYYNISNTVSWSK